MNGKQRRQEILNFMKKENSPVSGEKLAKALGVSRQVIVQDIALLRAEGHEIIATNKGYLCSSHAAARRVFHVNHKTEDIAKELNLIVDFGAVILDVFVEHEPYGELNAPLNIRTRRGVLEFLENLNNGTSSPLMTITSGDHYHTVQADSETTLDEIQKELKNHGFLVL